MYKHNPKLLLPPRYLVRIGFFIVFVASVFGCQVTDNSRPDQVPAGFVDIGTVVPGIVVDVRYATADNFVGAPVTGYEAARIYLTVAAAQALRDVQQDLAASGLGLKVFDGYRPQRAVDHFVRWAQDLDDTRMKSDYYPAVAKQNLFSDGYIAARSGHSRGSTVDLTLIRLTDGQELDMGSPWDFFDPVSWPSSDGVTPAQYANRMQLREAMLKHGFAPLTTEWWHFTHENEPYPATYFDFAIRPE